ncbi:hypothetical protein LTS10_010692 [Elasticomyces elasticus]|nr:hypothetical protein LTS10_010692 [Elasticomyces elasticus]
MANQTTSRLLALPAELRVRIYEYVFEDLSSQLEIDISLVKGHAPKVAIVAVSRLIRREALEMAEQAVSRFFSNHKFFLDLNQLAPAVKDYLQDPHNAQNPMACLPRYPILTLELRFKLLLVCSSADQYAMSIKVASSYEPVSREYTMTCRHTGFTGNEACEYGTPITLNKSLLQATESRYYIQLTQGDTHSCTINLVAKSFFRDFWHGRNVT